jgi:hypothetical protein
MSQAEKIKFNKPIDQNDINIVESIIYPIFSKKNEQNKRYRKKIQSLLFSAMKHVNTNSF